MTTVILIPGLICDEIVWQPVINRLNGAAKVAMAPDLDNITEMAQEFLDRYDGALAVIGHSMGARLAPERIERLGLLDTGIHPLRNGEIEKRAEIVEFARKNGMEALADRWLPGMIYEPHQSNPNVMGPLRYMVLRADPELHARQINALVNRPDASSYLAKITCPTLLVVGRQDQWSPVSQHEVMLNLLPNARLEIVKNAGHFAPVERPNTVARIISEFLNSSSGKVQVSTSAIASRASGDTIPVTPLFDRRRSTAGYELNKMANTLGTPEGRAAFMADEAVYIDRFGVSADQKAAVLARDWEEMVRLGGNLFYILKITAVDPLPITAIGAAQAGMSHEEFLKKRLGKYIWHTSLAA